MKFRHPEFEAAAAIDVRPATPGGAARIKFKEELLPLRESLGGIRSIFSHNCVLAMPRERLNMAVKDLTNSFPAIKQVEASSDAPVKIVNDMAGTTSVLTLGFATDHLDTAVASWVGSFRDNTGSGGILAVTKIGINKQILTGNLHTYSGPTCIKEGTIEFGTSAAPSPNSDHYVTSPGSLSLLYSGSKPIKRLFLNGVQLGLGTYDAASHPDLILGSGSIQVTDDTPVTLTISRSGSNVTVTWPGGGLLQESTTLADWTDMRGVSSPYVTPIAGAQKFFRIKE